MKVRDGIRLLELDGWRIVRTRGSHRQLRNDRKKGLFTLPGNPGDELAPGTLNSTFEQAGLRP